MLKRTFLLAFIVALALVPVYAQQKPALVVHAFTVAPDVAKWPYDSNQLQNQTIAVIKVKNEIQFDVVPDASSTQARVYTLDGEVLEWHKGNTTERMLIAAGTGAGR